MFSRGDLHIHSTASDGAHSPQEIVVLAKNRGIDVVALADHNSVSGIDEASEAAINYGISVIPAVELSTRYNGESIHILGYFKDRKYTDNNFRKILMEIKNHNGNKVRLALKGYRSKPTVDRFLSTSEGIELLRVFGASVVLAHPVRISQKNLLELLGLSFDGIEAKYCHSSNEQNNHFINTALSRFPFYTGGSDFHTNLIQDNKHCLIGDPFLNTIEIQRFLKGSGALVLGAGIEARGLCSY